MRHDKAGRRQLRDRLVSAERQQQVRRSKMTQRRPELVDMQQQKFKKQLYEVIEWGRSMSCGDLAGRGGKPLSRKGENTVFRRVFLALLKNTQSCVGLLPPADAITSSF